jgi:hypothetical protein
MLNPFGAVLDLAAQPTQHNVGLGCITHFV